KVRKHQPAAYMKICALLVPKEMKLEHSSAAIKAMTTEQIERSIELIKEILAQREAGANAKVIEGTAQGAALSAPTELEQPRRKRRNRLLEHVNTAIGPSRKPRVPTQNVLPAHDVNGNAVITVDNSGDTITLVGVHSSALHASDFHFV